MANTGTATLTGCTLSGNSGRHQGGGLANGGAATLTTCTLSGNSAVDGGGVANTGTATLTACTLSGNSSGNGGGACVRQHRHGQPHCLHALRETPSATMARRLQ